MVQYNLYNKALSRGPKFQPSDLKCHYESTILQTGTDLHSDPQTHNKPALVWYNTHSFLAFCLLDSPFNNKLYAHDGIVYMCRNNAICTAHYSSNLGKHCLDAKHGTKRKICNHITTRPRRNLLFNKGQQEVLTVCMRMYVGVQLWGEEEQKNRSTTLNTSRKTTSLWNKFLPHLSVTSPRLSPHNCVFICPHRRPFILAVVMEEKPRKKGQDEGIPRCGSQAWRRGECGLGALLGCMQLAFSEG